jgi:hypothetical protein
MKKIVLSLLALAATMNIMAVTYSAKATITLESQDSYESCQMIIGESDELAAGLNNGEYAEINMEGRSVALYVEYEGVKYQHFASAPATMKNLTLGAMTDAATDYNLIISDVTGSFTIKLGDAEPFVVAEGTNVISLTPGQTAAIGVINYEAAPVYAAQVTTNAYGFASFSYDQDLAPVEAGVMLYKGAISGDELALTSVADIAANQGVIVYGDANTTYHFDVINGATADFAGNDLKASSKWADRSGSIFCLKGDALYEYTGENFPANKAFLQIASTPNGAPRRISFRFNGTQAIDNVADEAKAVKFMENGQVIVIKNGVKFNTLGQIVK